MRAVPPHGSYKSQNEFFMEENENEQKADSINFGSNMYFIICGLLSKSGGFFIIVVKR
jgi:hypothetical protein